MIIAGRVQSHNPKVPQHLLVCSRTLPYYIDDLFHQFAISNLTPIRVSIELISVRCYQP